MVSQNVKHSSKTKVVPGLVELCLQRKNRTPKAPSPPLQLVGGRLLSALLVDAVIVVKFSKPEIIKFLNA